MLILCDRKESPGRAAGPGYDSREIPFSFAALWSARWEVSCALVADLRDFGAEDLAARINGLPKASRVLDWERNLHEQGFINIERLMTRLDSLMPYDED